jgi:hypothetical protein
MKKGILALTLLCLSVLTGFSQTTVTVKGQGNNRNEALNDARRNAIASGIGTRVNSETQVQDMVALASPRT